MARSGEVAPDMRSALSKACAGLEVELFVKDLDCDVCVEASDALGAEEGAEARVWFHRFRSACELLVPAGVLPTRGNFWSLMARRVRPLNATGRQKKEMLVGGTEYRAAWKLYSSPDPRKVVQTRERDVAAGPSPKKCVRRVKCPCPPFRPDCRMIGGCV